jgi:hypothetical protein
MDNQSAATLISAMAWILLVIFCVGFAASLYIAVKG